MKPIGLLLAVEAIITASWAVTSPGHDIGFLIGLLIAGAIIARIAGREKGGCVR